MSVDSVKSLAVGKNSKRQRILYFDVFRAFAPIAIIMIHVFDPIYRNKIDYYSGEYFWSHAVLACLRWAVPIFIMISGAIFLDPKRSFDLKKHYKKYVLHLVIAYVVWSVVYGIGQSLTMDGDDSARLQEFMFRSFGGHYHHLWFLLMLLAMYVMVPILRKITADRGLMKYFLFVGIIACFALPLVADYCRILIEASSQTNPFVMGLLSGIADVIGYFSGKLLLNYTVYFVLGYYLATEDISRKKRCVFYAIGLGSLVVNIFLSPIRAHLLGASLDGDLNGADLQNINFLSLALSVAVFVFLRHRLSSVKKMPTAIAFMAKYSFGVYLIHYVFISFVLYKFIFTSEMTMANMWYLVPIFTVLIYLVSLGAIWVISKIPILKKVV